MPTAEAHVPTSRASRYLVQFCRHTSQMSRMRHWPPARQDSGQPPPAVQHADWSATTGTVRFARGQCTLRATADTLTLRVDAADEDTLRRLQDGIARRLETIGRRDQLAVSWQRQDSASGLLPGEATSAPPAPPGRAAARRPRWLGRTLILAGAAALAIVVHLGLLGGAQAASAWAGWGAGIILAIIVLKVVTVGAHVVLGRSAIRRGGTVHARWKLRHSSPEPLPAAVPLLIGRAAGTVKQEECS